MVTTLDDCFTIVEKRMIAEGAFGQVRETRPMFQDWMGPAFVKFVEDATGRRVKAFFSSSTHDPDVAVELFLLEPTGASSNGDQPIDLDDRYYPRRPADSDRVGTSNVDRALAR